MNPIENEAMEEELNYVGATVFWFYILAALFLTVLVNYTIPRIPRSQVRLEDRYDSNVALFSILAGLSFSILSYNMLSVLIDSFSAWSSERNMGGRIPTIHTIWEWSITSTLFRDFAEAVVENAARYFWAQSALLATLSVSVYVGQEGKSSVYRER